MALILLTTPGAAGISFVRFICALYGFAGTPLGFDRSGQGVLLIEVPDAHEGRALLHTLVGTLGLVDAQPIGFEQQEGERRGGILDLAPRLHLQDRTFINAA